MTQVYAVITYEQGSSLISLTKAGQKSCWWISDITRKFIRIHGNSRMGWWSARSFLVKADNSILKHIIVYAHPIHHVEIRQSTCCRGYRREPGDMQEVLQNMPELQASFPWKISTGRTLLRTRNVISPAKERSWLLLCGLRALREIPAATRILLRPALEEFFYSIVSILIRQIRFIKSVSLVSHWGSFPGSFFLCNSYEGLFRKMGSKWHKWHGLGGRTSFRSGNRQKIPGNPGNPMVISGIFILVHFLQRTSRKQGQGCPGCPETLEQN